VRRVYAFGGDLLSRRYLPNAMGLEPVSQAAYKYDADGALADHADHVRIATALAAQDGWLAYWWHPECAEIFMRSADLVIWFDNPHARRMRGKSAGCAQTRPAPVDIVAREALRRRQRGEIEDRVSLLDLARSASAPDAIGPYVQMATSDFAGKLLRVTNKKQIAALQSVRPNR
jgi:hypothetical protein